MAFAFRPSLSGAALVLIGLTLAGTATPAQSSGQARAGLTITVTVLPPPEDVLASASIELRQGEHSRMLLEDERRQLARDAAQVHMLPAPEGADPNEPLVVQITY